MLKSCSNLYWFSNPPAAARVVAREEMKIEGVGVRAASSEGHLDVSGETKVVSFALGAPPAAAGVRREIVSTRVTDGLARRLLRMWPPWRYVRFDCLT